ncbi:MAG: hypothetical protein CBC19_04105 [Oceanospirillales bacterium TMED59]|mgnify:CR=1 FL=1|nr:MAG: hypothetical protein CBC19_04105 [Oceanospirillales bacterium TMED59]|tara:strand:+ start:1253 stop:2725 length:1473 start_codon:yes stop_codon:yes gene_type:complete
MGQLKNIQSMLDNYKPTFVSGLFNILHPGHRRFLDFAASKSSHLIVGVFSDAAAGDSAYMPEEVRIAAVKGYLKSAEVILLDGDLKSTLIKLKPRLVVKGPEYKNRENIEKIVGEWGGEIIFSAGNEKTGANIQVSTKDFQVPWELPEIKNFLKRRKISKASLINIVGKFKDTNVLTIGDIILDIYQYCRPLGMSKEDPTIVVQPIREEKFLGGAGIVAAHARALNAQSRIISVVGKDQNNRITSNFLSEYGVENSILFDASRKTTIKTRIKCEGKTLLRFSDLVEVNLSNEKILDVITEVKKYIDETDLIMLSDFNYGILPPGLVKELTSLKKSKKLLMTADSQSSSQYGDISRFKKMDLITPTEHEARIALNDKESGIVSIAYNLIKQSKAKNLFITLGEDGVLIQDGKNIDNANSIDRLPALAKVCRDNSGAGDSMLTAASIALANGADIWHAAFLGAVISGLQVSTIGNQPISSDKIIEAICACGY